MADKKISALTAASTPLAGTEVLPIVQSGSTVKVSVANLTAGRTVGASRVVAGTSDSTVGTLEAATTSSGATTRNLLVQNTSANLNAGVRIDLMTSGNTNRVAYIKGVNTSGGGGATDVIIATNPDFGTPVDAFKVDSTGNITAITGNLIQGTAAKGVNFTANSAAAGMTSQLLNWYEEGTWTPNQGAGLTLVGAFSSAGTYTRIGRQVFIRGSVSGATSVAVASAGAIATNLPYSAAADATGTAINAADNASSILRVSSATLTAATVIAATTTITFSAVYSV